MIRSTNKAIDTKQLGLALGIDKNTITIKSIENYPTSKIIKMTINEKQGVRKLFLKTPQKNNMENIKIYKKEINFYQKSKKTNYLSLPKFIYGKANLRECVLILEDISDNHIKINRKDNLDLKTIEKMITTMAILHANISSQPSFKKDFLSKIDNNTIHQSFMRGITDHIDHFRIKSTYNLTEEDNFLIFNIIKKLPKLLKNRLKTNSQQKPLTITHSDPHPGNFLKPKIGHSLCLIDWQDWKLSFAACDIVHLLILSLPSSIIADNENSLLSLYVNRYSKERKKELAISDFIEDYTLATLRSVCVPIRHWAIGLSEEIWKPQLDNALSACNRLDAYRLL